MRREIIVQCCRCEGLAIRMSPRYRPCGDGPHGGVPERQYGRSRDCFNDMPAQKGTEEPFRANRCKIPGIFESPKTINVY